MSNNTEQNKTAEDVLRGSFDRNIKSKFGCDLVFEKVKGSNGYDWIYEAMEEYASARTKELEEALRECKTEALFGRSEDRLRTIANIVDKILSPSTNEKE